VRPESTVPNSKPFFSIFFFFGGGINGLIWVRWVPPLTWTWTGPIPHPPDPNLLHSDPLDLDCMVLNQADPDLLVLLLIHYMRVQVRAEELSPLDLIRYLSKRSGKSGFARFDEFGSVT